MKFGFYRLQDDNPDADTPAGTGTGSQGSDDPSTDDQSTGDDGVSKLQGALKSERENSRNLARQLKQLQSQLAKIDPEAYQAAQQELETLRQEKEEQTRKKLESEQQYHQALQLERDKFSERQTAWEGRQKESAAEVSKYKSMAEAIAVEQAINAGFLSAGGDPTRLAWIRDSSRIQSMLRFDFETQTVLVKDPSTDSALEIDGKPVTPKQYFETVVAKEQPDFFLSDNKASGGGTPPTSSNNSAPVGKRITAKTPRELKAQLWSSVEAKRA